MRPSTITYPPQGMKPIGIIQFVHGMCEKRQRYEKTMKFFSRHGFICAIADTKGHGENIITTDDLGYFGDEGYKGLIEDVHDYTLFLKREFPNLPLVLLGHSMGSLIVRAYLKKYSKEIDALIISGSPSDRLLASPAKILIKFMTLIRGEHYRSPMLNNMLNGPFEKPFENEGLLNAWLTRDRFAVDEFNNDPLCGFTFTLNGFLTLMNLITQVYGKTGWVSKNKALPVMFISGGDDPCRRNDKAFKKAVSHLKKCGYPNTFYKLYPEMRHELFNELNNEEVYDDILKFLEFKAGIEEQ